MYVTLQHNIMMLTFNINTDTNDDVCQFASCTHLNISYNTYVHRSKTHDIIQPSLYLCYLRRALLSTLSKEFRTEFF